MFKIFNKFIIIIYYFLLTIRYFINSQNQNIVIKYLEFLHD